MSANNVKDILSTASYYVQQQAGQTTSSGVTVTLTRDSTDDVMFPSTGSRNSASVEYTGGPFMGDVSFTRYWVSSAWFFPLPLDTVIGVRVRAGMISGNGGKEVPIYERYYLGGIGSLRGLRSVGPTDPATGEVIGGLTMLNFNADYVFPLMTKAGLKGVLFFDTGNSWESGYHIGDMRRTAGVGIRWYSPIGPLRLECGYVLDRKENESTSRFEFTIG
ncbi:MAG: BamA/TamA family outer membrane protein, partial [Deltaproteobacteria bacterium]|nr:BamA/TamA family outer membrane protein [Deltaproteobacteria bacterium]